MEWQVYKVRPPFGHHSRCTDYSVINTEDLLTSSPPLPLPHTEREMECLPCHHHLSSCVLWAREVCHITTTPLSHETWVSTDSEWSSPRSHWFQRREEEYPSFPSFMSISIAGGQPCNPKTGVHNEERVVYNVHSHFLNFPYVYWLPPVFSAMRVWSHSCRCDTSPTLAQDARDNTSPPPLPLYATQEGVCHLSHIITNPSNLPCTKRKTEGFDSEGGFPSTTTYDLTIHCQCEADGRAAWVYKICLLFFLVKFISNFTVHD